jgi:hypothetical protein
MTEETAKLLIEAANRLAAAIEQATGGLAAAGGGIHIYHHHVQPLATGPHYNPNIPPTTWGMSQGGIG